ncbi:Plant self-incompatibility protein S1 family [Arabidopsis thaliana]|uniref:Plant self-incompatibility protein S1 family n=1 Tax=Arabidopsis thaliana TaxID=3702 RepID=F4JZP8_ARATH|nr:Plant self-incompatibility protein S1 family [Arabidopsis thaliana]AED93522.2 Plant self-incompatibility protein S1 family [Arabidopsis thaliana]|eukprot:NP_001318654.1 Plant self-incompatibility protein S1 family [Arabidopsis thaliana]
MEARYRKDYKSEYKVNPDTVTHIVVSNELYGLKKGNAGFVCSHGPKKWRQSKPGDRYILLKFKHNVHVTVVSYAGRSHFVTTELKIRNGMQGLKRPEIVYHCQAINSGLDYGWRRALRPPFGHSFHVLLEGGQKLEEEIHRCHFRKACAVHEVTPEGIMFDGKEWNFEERYPRLIPKKYLEAKWKPWPRRTSRSSGGQASGRRSSGDVGFTLMMKNEMFGLKRPSVLYRCKAYDKSLRWHVSIPTAEFTWDFEVPPFGTGVVIHRCEFKSSQGTADVEIKTLSMTSTLCGGHLCKYVIRPNGVYFVGFETYYPHNIFLRFLEFVRPVDKLVEPWKAWSPRQLKALRERTNNRTRLHEDNNRTRLHGDKDADEDEKDDD